MRFYSKLGMTAIAASMLAMSSAQARVDGDTITLGSAISFTGKYSTNGIHAKNGYDIAVKMINLLFYYLYPNQRLHIQHRQWYRRY